MSKKLLYTACALLLPIHMAFASGPPATKPGLWSVSRQTIDNPGNKKKVWPPIKVCHNHAFDIYVNDLMKRMPGCTTVSESTQGNKSFSELKCVIGKSVVETKGTTTYQGDTFVHSESNTTYAPALYGTSETTMTGDLKYIGSCPVGMQPGDQMNANGTISHLWKH